MSEVQDVNPVKVQKVKSAYLLNFIKYTQWPEGSFKDDSAPIVLGVVGDMTVLPMLEKVINGKKPHNRSVKVERFKLPVRSDFENEVLFDAECKAVLTRLQACHLLYVNDKANDAGSARDILASLDTTAVMTVATGKKMTESGAMLALDIEDGKIVFYANVELILGSSLKVSSKLLRLARK